MVAEDAAHALHERFVLPALKTDGRHDSAAHRRYAVTIQDVMRAKKWLEAGLRWRPARRARIHPVDTHEGEDDR